MVPETKSRDRAGGTEGAVAWRRAAKKAMPDKQEKMYGEEVDSNATAHINAEYFEEGEGRFARTQNVRLQKEQTELKRI